MINTEKPEKIFASYQKTLRSGGMSVRIESGDGSFIWKQSCGDLAADKPFALASVTKLFATTVLLNLVKEGKLSIEDTIAKYLPDDIINGLHVYKGIDYSRSLTVLHLMTQTGGLPDYFTETGSDGISGEKMMKHDRSLSLEERIMRNKALKAKYRPGSKKKSFYSDINWDLFQPVIETITGKSIAECFEKYIFKPLNLQNTYLFQDGQEFSFPGYFQKNFSINITVIITLSSFLWNTVLETQDSDIREYRH